MIEQYSVATPKYNFPQLAMDADMPRTMLEISLRSLRSDGNQPIIRFGGDQNEMKTNMANLKLTPIQIRPKKRETIVAAIDTSCVNVGETRSGVLIAVRGANVWKHNKKYRYVRLGPFIFHITDENKTEVYNMLLSAYFGQQSRNYTPNLSQLPTRLASLLERWLQLAASKTMSGSIILFDGSLTAGTQETPARIMREILQTSRRMGNVVLGFSKATAIRLNGGLITEIMPECAPPFVVELTSLIDKPPLVSFGSVYVARLANGSYAFRVDVDRELQSQDRIDAIERLAGNDMLSQGYPETLRLAHILCTFTANEVIAMQHFLARRYGLKIISRPDMHRVLFGPFGRGEENA